MQLKYKEMKNLVLIFSVLIITASCKSQVINIKDKNGTRQNGAYYKDVDNELNQFEGTYQYVNGNDELTIVFKKHVHFYLTPYAEDLLLGEIKYKKNGLVLFDNLSKINDNLTNKYDHDICGNSLLTNTGHRPVCDDCQPNQYRVSLIFFGRSNNARGGSIILKKFTENGQEKMKITVLYLGAISSPILDPLIPWGDYVLTRIN